MEIRELIEKLNEYPDDMQVAYYIEREEGGTHVIEYVNKIQPLTMTESGTGIKKDFVVLSD